MKSETTLRTGSPSRHARALACLGALLVVCAGCDEGPQVRAYSVPKETPPLPAARGMSSAAAAPRGMAWSLPAGWAEVANTSSMRFATLAAGTDDDRIEIAITRLVGSAGGVAGNVNRWRDQVGLPAASEEELPSMVERITARGTEGLMVDLIGPAGEGAEAAAPRMLAAIFPTEANTWFIKTAGDRAVLDAHREAFVEFCSSVTFGGAAAAAPPSAMPSGAMPGGGGGGGDGAPVWDRLPEGWAVDASPKSMSVASITVSGSDQQAALTITPLGGSQDMLSNVNRWRRQVGLGPLASLADDPPRPIEVAGAPGHLINAGGADQRILAVVSVRGGMTWFYKLSGPDPLVSSQLDAFNEFIRSIRFTEGGNA
ncbi:MAG: hypothetical protein GY715_15740 [Planctomycetes bacterium]|nr:hypothetical protein [Planctomycetota bacterium]